MILKYTYKIYNTIYIAKSYEHIYSTLSKFPSTVPLFYLILYFLMILKKNVFNGICKTHR